MDTTNVALIRMRKPEVSYMPSVYDLSTPAAQMGLTEMEYRDLVERLLPAILL